MTDKPDVAAMAMTHLLSWLPEGYTHCKHGTREWCESYLNNARDVIEAQAAELTRLAAENRTYAEAHAFNSERFGEMLSERDAAKAEIARLTDYNARLHADIAETGKDNDELEAEIARLRDTIDGLLGETQEMREAALKPDTGE